MIPHTRQLAAIMFTDIVGYSRLMNRNEGLGFELLHEHRALVRELLTRHRGVEVDTAGDGFAVKFSSARDAFACALQIQKTFATRNRLVDRQRRIRLRIGIHVSDVLESRADAKHGVYGDGVNIAARLQPFSPAGGICISSSVYDQVRGHFDCAITPLGTTSLKGIEQEIRVYAVELTRPRFSSLVYRQVRSRRVWTALLGMAAGFSWAVYFMASPSLARPSAPRVAVMPFEAPGLGDGQGFLPNGLTSSLISALSNAGVHVLAESSMATAKKSGKSPRDLGRELGIDRLVTGAISVVGKFVRLSVSMVDTKTQEVLWSQVFEGPRDRPLELTAALSDGLARRLVATRKPSAVSGRRPGELTDNNDAYVAYLKGQFNLARRTEAGFRAAADEFQKAINLDPDFAAAYAQMAITSQLEAWYGTKPPALGAIGILRNANKALSLDPELTEALLVLAEEKAYLENDFAAADEFYRRALASNSRHALTRQWYAEFLAYQGRVKESFEEIEKAVELDPLNPIVIAARGSMRYFARDFNTAIEHYRSGIRLDPSQVLGHYWLGRALTAKGEYRLAIESLERAVQLSNREPMTLSALAYALALSGDSAGALELAKDIEAASKKRYVSPYFLAKVESALGHDAAAIRLLQKSVIELGNQTVAAFVDPEFDRLRGLAEFKRTLASIRPDDKR